MKGYSLTRTLESGDDVKEKELWAFAVDVLDKNKKVVYLHRGQFNLIPQNNQKLFIFEEE